MKILEYVCTANQGRSPVAKFLAQHHLRKKQMDNIYRAISSGVQADNIQNGQVPPKVMKKYIGKALEQSLLGKDGDEMFRTAENENDIVLMKDLYDQAVGIFKEREHREKMMEVDRLIEQYGIEGTLKTNPSQTIARDDTIVVLGMTKRHADAIHDIYSKKNGNSMPIIDTIPGFAGYKGVEIEDAFGQPSGAVKVAVNMLEKYVPEATQRATEL